MPDVTAFGYVVPIVIILVAVALVVGLSLAVSFYLTISLSVYRSVKETRRNRVRPALRDELLSRLFAESPDWNTWAEELSRTERVVVEELLDEHLRELDGRDADKLRELGDALGIPEREGRRLENGHEYARLNALTWLTLLRRPEPYLMSSFEPETARERAAAVTLLQTTNKLSNTEAAVSMLLDGTNDQFTVFGQDTLYRVSRGNAAPLIQTASDRWDQWPEPLLVQVLAVCAHLETSVSTESLEWLTAALETEHAAIRAAAADALGSFGWRASLRDQMFLERATNDPSPHVRAAVYNMLASWGDEQALTVLLFALVEETDPRALTLGTTALVRRRERIDTDAAAVLGNAWDWSYEHAEYDQIARTGSAEALRG